MATVLGPLQARPDAADITTRLASRVLVATRSTFPADLADLMRAHNGHSGVVAVGSRAGTLVTSLLDAHGVDVVAHDPARYESVLATAARPMVFDAQDRRDCLLDLSLDDYVAGASSRLSAVFSPTGAIRAGDVAALESVVTSCNTVDANQLVCTLPVASDWLTEDEDRRRLVSAIRESTHPVAVVIIGQFDPFEKRDAIEGLLEILATVGSQTFVHRTDLVAVHAVGSGALAASVGTSTALRHTIPVGQFAGRRSKSSQPGLHIFVPGIDSFRELATLEDWFVDSPPVCRITECVEHDLTDFTQGDRARLASHNCAGMLGVAASMFDSEPRHWASWLTDYWRGVGDEYELLRVETKRRDIKPYGAAKHLIPT